MSDTQTKPLLGYNAHSGSEDAAVGFNGNYPRIFRYIMSMVHDQAEAEDLTQETFLRAYKNRESLRDEAARIAWLYRIATNLCLDRLRQFARLNPVVSDADIEQVEIAEPNSPSLQQIIEQEDMSGCVQSYLSRLSDSYRAVIMLHDMHGLTTLEIAKLLGESQATVKIRLHRSRRKLSQILCADCDFSHDERDVLVCEAKN